MKNMLFSFFVFIICFAIAGCSDQIEKDAEKENLAHETNKPSQSTGMNNVVADHNKQQSSPIDITPITAKDKIILDIPIIKQNPELKYGCEVTSLTMVLNHAGIRVGKLKLADELPKDDDPVKKSPSGDITHWGNPNHGFVGDVTGKNAGYAIYAKPLEKLMNQYLQNRTVNLTRKPFDKILTQIKNGKPVILWTTGDYKIPDRWESWRHGNQKINTPLDLHAVVLVGFDKKHLYLNDPLSGKKAHKTKKEAFLKSWKALGQQALSYN